MTISKTIDAMARTMVERTFAAEACTDADLHTAGFTAAEIEIHGEAAKAKARRLVARAGAYS